MSNIISTNTEYLCAYAPQKPSIAIIFR